MTRSRFLPLLAGAFVLSGCADHTAPFAPAPEAPRLSAHQSVVNVSGSWSWSAIEQLTFPAWVAEGIFEIDPEGPTTLARCTGSGTLTLVQDGASFTGTMQHTAAECVTKGGQAFVDALAFVPRPVTGGEVTGRKIRFTTDGVVVDCQYGAVIAQMDNSVALSLEGRSHCTLPGHPHSQIPADPPPGGTSRSLSWTAVRL